MSFTSYSATTPGTYYLHSAPPSVDPKASPKYAPVRACTPTIIISPLPVATPLPVPAVVVNIQNTSYYDSPSPATTSPAFTTPFVNPLVAVDSDPYQYKIYYDLSKDLNSVHGPYSLISDEQMHSLVVQGAPHGNFRIAFDHPALISTIKFERPLVIGDLLKALHSHFNKRPSSREKTNIERDMYLLQTAVDTQIKRCQATFDPQAEWDRGMKRVDILGKECKFCGVYLDGYVGGYDVLRVVFGK